MKPGTQIILAMLLVSLTRVGVRASETLPDRFVPNPLEWPDYGGTPDIKVAEGVGLEAAELDEILGRLGSADQSARSEAKSEVKRNARGSEEVLKKALFGRHGAKNSEMKLAMRTAAGRAPSLDKITSELIAIDPSHPELGRGTSGALRILSMLEALDSLDSLAAYKIMIEFSLRHAGVFRLDIGRKLVAHGIDVLPALIYSRGSDNREVHMFSVKWIRDMGNPLLGEQVKIQNPRRLAQLLEAYASVNDLDAINVTLSLTNHDSVIVRNAARKCIAKYGKNAKWPLRRQFENTFAKEPPKDTEFSDWAEALYDHYDRERLRPMTELFERGLRAFKEEKYTEMDEAFGRVLRGSPMFPSRHEMARCYLVLSDHLYGEDRIEEARAKLVLASRLAIPGSDTAKRAQGVMTWMRAEELREAGTPDPELYRTVLKFYPDHPKAQSRYEELRGERTPTSKLLTKSLIVSFFVFLAAMLVWKRIK